MASIAISISTAVPSLVVDFELPHDPDVPARASNVDLEGAAGDDPLLLTDVPVADVPLGEDELGGAAGVGRQVQLLEAPELLGRGQRR
jgi:hypothetical protein